MHSESRRSKQGLWRLACAVLFAAVALSAFASEANAQVRSNIAGVNLTAILGDSISVAASPGLVNFNLISNGVATGSPTVVVNTAWVFGSGAPPTVTTYAYFSNSVSALTDGGGHNIPSSSVSGSVNGGGFQTFTGACPFSANTCVQIFTKKITGNPNQRRGSSNTNLQLQISTVGLTLPAGTYTGVLHIQAQAL